MAVLEFKNYSVEEINYKKNGLYKNNKNGINLIPKIKVKNNFDDDKIMVTITINIGSLDNENSPFTLNVSVTGDFVYHSEEDRDDVGVDTLVHKNAVAILFPYVRTVVSSITKESNDYPALILPTINVAQVLAEQENSSEISD